MAFAPLFFGRALWRAWCFAPRSRSGGEVEGELAALVLGGRLLLLDLGTLGRERSASGTTLARGPSGA
jgi:hypothetical protein